VDDQGERREWTINAWLIGIVAGLAMLGALAAAYEIGRNSSDGDQATTVAETPAATGDKTTGDKTTGDKTTGDKTTGEGPNGAATDQGQSLFTASCGGCHTLAAAGTTGTTGPNLDDLQPDEATVTAAIANGGTGSGVMPPDLYTGEQAQQVAAYVASAAGG
jgi:mono/diheme cytochrome c family protein